MVRVFCVATMIVMVLELLAAGAARGATFTVTSTADSGPGSLRQRILDANNNPGPDTIEFDLSGTGCDATSGVCKISPSSALPEITGPVTINGYSQPGARRNTLAVGNDAVLKVELSGAGTPVASFANGLEIQASGSVIEGMIINGWENGVFLETDAAENRVQGNFIGTDALGTASRGNNIGVVARGNGNTVGGTRAAARNVISGNSGFGVHIVSNGNTVQGNYIGTDADGTGPLGNNLGVVIDATENNTIGGTRAAERNVISGNFTFGIRISFGAAGNRVQGNFIGTDATGTAPLGNGGDGISIQENASGNTIGGRVTDAANPRNVISGNGDNGIEIVDNDGATGNRILSNSIHDNDALGIDLVHTNDPPGVTPNDAGDFDAGPNNLQNYPVLDFTRTGRRATVIRGTLNSTAGTTFTLQIFSSPQADPSTFGEGRTFRFQKSVTTDSNGDAAFSFSTERRIPRGQVVSATATNQTTGDTSEFSQAANVT